MNAIEISKLTKSFRGKRGSVVDALKYVDFTVEKGEVFGFLGPNGAGKSTTIKIIIGLINPTSGSAAINGVDSKDVRARDNTGYLPENPAFFDYLTAEEYLYFVGRQFRMGDSKLKKEVEDVLKRLELWDARKRYIRTYSKGMVQRVGLAQALVHDPEIYILDEPMSGLDPIGRALVKKIILELKARGKTVFFSTHITDDVEKVCDRVGILYKGELKLVERVETIMTEGITGYQVRVKGGAGEITDHILPKDQLETFISAQNKAGFDLQLVEPLRKNLEELFLSLVKGS